MEHGEKQHNYTRRRCSGGSYRRRAIQRRPMKSIPFYSRHNQVYPVLRQGRAAVEKHFSDRDGWRRERELYAVLSGSIPVPEVLGEEPGLLVLEYENHPTLLAELERQKRDGFDAAPWQGLASWLRQCHGLCGQLPTDGNLSNFLWNSGADQIIGLDLEGYGPDSLNRCGARLAAAVLTCAPEDTGLRRQIAGVLGAELSVPDDLLNEVRRGLAACRRGAGKALSGVVLAGGRSRRMGESKAGLVLAGRTLLQRQVDKLRALDIEDVMLSGADCTALPGTRTVPDEYRGQGPLGGLHACLRAARNDTCLVVSVDAPLIPHAALAHLCQAHSGGVTVLRHGGWEEPLMGVYDRAVSGRIAARLEAGERAVRGLKRTVRWQCFDYAGPEELLMNCNTPEEFAAAKGLVRAYAAAGLEL